jgi:hypothetical protein
VILEANGPLVEELRPVGDWPGPFLDDVDIGQIKQFANSLLARERRLVFGDFPQLAVIAFDGVSGVNQAPDFCDLVNLLEILDESITISSRRHRAGCCGSGG